MASNTFYATSASNTSYNAILNGGEGSWERAGNTKAVNWDLGYFTYNMSSIRSTIPSVATISSVTFSIQFRQNRSNTSLYHSLLTSQLFIDSTSKSSETTSARVADGWTTLSYSNSTSITSS